MKRILTYARFLGFAYPTAFAFEFIADTFGDGQLFSQPDPLLAFILFLIWYGFFYSLAFTILEKRGLFWVVVYFAIAGTIVEIIVFHRVNFIVDPVIYAIMGIVPFYLSRKF